MSRSSPSPPRSSRRPSARPESLATMIYTSGTTGRPKGVELPHRVWTFQVPASRLSDHQARRRALPVAAAGPRVRQGPARGPVPQIGCQDATDRRVPKIVTNLPVVKPTLMAGIRASSRVPRHQRQGQGRRRGQGEDLRLGVRDLCPDQAGRARRQVARARRPADGPGRQAGAVEDPELTGGNIRIFVSGSRRSMATWPGGSRRGRPADPGGLRADREHRCCVHRAPRRPGVRLRSASRSGTQVQIADDGEVLLKGPHVMRRLP